MLQAPAIDVFVPSFLLRLRSYGFSSSFRPFPLPRRRSSLSRCLRYRNLPVYIFPFIPVSLSLSLYFSQPWQITAAAVAVCLSTLIVTYTRRCKALYGPLTAHSRLRSHLGRNRLAISRKVTIVEIHYTVPEKMEFCRIYFSINDLRNKVFVISR